MSLPLYHRLNAASGDRAMVLIHGVTDSLEAWTPMISHLPRNCKILRLDLRGHHRSPLPKKSTLHTVCSDGYQLSDYSGDVIELLERLDLQKSILVGHSLGGLVAQDVAVRRPDLAGGLVLVASTSNAMESAYLRTIFDQTICRRVQAAAARRRLEFPARVLGMSMQELDPELGSWIREEWCHDGRAHPSWCARSAEIIGALKLQTWLGALKGLLETNVREHVSALRTPVLILHGSADEVFPAETHLSMLSAALARSAPVIKVYRGCGHNLLWHDPKHLAEDVMGFGTEIARASLA